MSDHTIAVGMPVRNGMPYIVEAIQAVRNQDHTNLEIVVCDNASTDDTGLVCAAMADADSRLRYLRFEENVGASENFNRAFRLTEAPYFAWAAHDDRFRPSFLSACLAALDASPRAAMCITSVALIDEHDREVGAHHESSSLANDRLRTRTRSYLRRNEWYLLYGLVRREVLERTTLFEPTWGTDVTLIWQVLLRHPITVIDEPLFEYRLYRNKDPRLVHEGLLPARNATVAQWRYATMWRRMWQLCGEADLPSTARRVARRELVAALATRWWRAFLAADLGNARLLAAEEEHRVRSLGFAVLGAALRPSEALRRVGRWPPRTRRSSRS